MLATLLCAAALAATPEVSAPTNQADAPWLAWSGLAGGVRTQASSPMGEGWIGLSREVVAHVRPEVDLGLGYAGAPQEVLTSMRFGVNLELTRGAATPFLWIAFAHNHESALDAVKKDPLPVVLGLSENGVIHRTGAELGTGVRLALGGGAGVGLRASATALLGDGPPVSLNALGFLSYAF